MDIEKQIEKYEQEIKEMKLTKGLNLNANQVATVVGTSPSTIENWRKDGIGIEYIDVKSYGKKRSSRVLYPIKNVAKWMVINQIKTV